MSYLDIERENQERTVLKSFFEHFCSLKNLEDALKTYKALTQTQNKLKSIFRGASTRCYCARSRYTICELCQSSDHELVELRTFFRNIKNSKKHNISNEKLSKIIEVAKNRVLKK